MEQSERVFVTLKRATDGAVRDNMAMSSAAQFGLLVWKNTMLQKRLIKQTIIWIIASAFLPLLLLAIRYLVTSEFISSSTVFDSFDASTLPDDLMAARHGGRDKRVLASPQWMLVYSPNTSRAATRMAEGTARMLNITPSPTGIHLEDIARIMRFL